MSPRDHLSTNNSYLYASGYSSAFDPRKHTATADFCPAVDINVFFVLCGEGGILKPQKSTNPANA